MKNKILLLATGLSVLLSASCKKSSNSNSTTYKTQMNFQLRASNTSNTVAQKTTANGLIVWNSGFANPSMVKFEATQNGAQIEYKSTNVDQIDLMAPVAVSFGGFTIPAGTYKEVELKLQFNKNGASPAIQLNGQFTTSLVSIPVMLQINEFHEIKTEQHDVVITDNSSFTAVTTLDLSVFTTGLTESMLLNADLTNGKIVISSSSNHSLYDIVIDNFEKKDHKCEFDKH